MVDLTIRAIDRIAARNDLSRQDKKELAADMVRGMRYDNGNYLWINDMDLRMVMHPVNPELEGQNLSRFKDTKGKHIFSEFVSLCRRSGEGTLEYYWPKPGRNTPVAKLAYAKLYEPWNWVIKTGVYLETAEERFKKNEIRQDIIDQGIKLTLTFLVLMGFTSLAIILINRRITRPIKETSDMLKDIAEGEGDLTRRLEVKSKDEVGRMAQWFNSFITKLHDIVRNISEYFETVSASANQLLIISRQMDEGIHDMGEKPML